MNKIINKKFKKMFCISWFVLLPTLLQAGTSEDCNSKTGNEKLECNISYATQEYLHNHMPIAPDDKTSWDDTLSLYYVDTSSSVHAASAADVVQDSGIFTGINFGK